jgi:hypothetical protein
MSIMNVNMDFKHLATEHDALLESNRKISIEKGDLEATVN